MKNYLIIAMFVILLLAFSGLIFYKTQKLQNLKYISEGENIVTITRPLRVGGDIMPTNGQGIAFSPDKRIYESAEDGEAIVFTLNTMQGNPKWKFERWNDFKTVAQFDTSGNLVLTGKLTIGTNSSPDENLYSGNGNQTGITMYDTEDGSAHCIKVAKGQLVLLNGSC